MPRTQNSDMHRYRKGVGTANLGDPKKDKWRMACTNKGTPKNMRRTIVYGLDAVERHFDKVAEFLKEHGRNKDTIINKICMDELTICVRQLESFNSQSDVQHGLEEVLNEGIAAIRKKKAKQQFPSLNQLIKQCLAHREKPQR